MALQTETDRIRHLLRRFGLGASAAEVAFYGEGGYGKALDRLLDWEGRPDVFQIRPMDFGTEQMPVNMRLLQSWWYLYFAATSQPLQAKLSLFWHDHFATARSKVDKVPAFNVHLQTLRTHCGGKFLDLLTAVSKDPAMLFWLDNCLNTKDRPNENFAREVMELFTVGVDGGYSEEDIQEAARAFTGWTFTVRAPRPNGAGGRNPQVFRGTQLPGGFLAFYDDRSQHDPGPKRVLGKSGNLTGDDVLKHLCTLPATSRYIVRKFWEYFVYRNPSDALVDRLAQAWQAKNLDIRALVRLVAESPEFVSEQAERATIKSPVDFTVSTVRSLGLGATVLERFQQTSEADRRFVAGLGIILTNATTSMGQEMMNPPDVSGWTSGEGWISSATMVERVKWADRLFGSRPVGGRQPSYAFNLLPFMSDRTVPGLVEKMIELFDAAPTANQRARMIEAAQDAIGTAPLSERNVGLASNAAARLLFGSPEFQLC
jgi:uncharacterized protein (DUF1800 family)